MMKSIGDLLRDYIHDSGNTIYGIAKKANVNRTTLQKIVSGDRFPSQKVLEKLFPFLEITPAEISELIAICELHRTDKNLYQQRQYIRQILLSEPASILNEALDHSPKRLCSSELIDFQDKSSQLFYGQQTVEHLLNDLLLAECGQKNPLLKINVSGDCVLLRNVLLHSIHYCSNYKSLQIQHLTSFSKESEKGSAALTNLNILFQTFAFTVIPEFHYRIYYYYNDLTAADPEQFAFPYYIIFTGLTVLLSSDCKTALLIRDRTALYYFQNHFETAIHKAFPLTAATLSARDTLPHLIHMAEEEGGIYHLYYRPYLTEFFTEEILRSSIKPEVDDYEYAIHLLLYEIKQLHKVNPKICFFHKMGLMKFCNDGIPALLSEKYMKPLSLKNRIYLLEALYKGAVNNRPVCYLLNPAVFSVSEFLACNFYQDKGIDFFCFDVKENISRCVYLKESTTLEAFNDFFKYISDSHLVCSKAESLAYLGECIDNLKKQQS